jgi:HlyD family secretion protein
MPKLRIVFASVFTCAALAASGAATAPGDAPTVGKTLLLGVAVSGVVAKLLVPDGAHVDAGQALLQIDCRPLEAEIKMRTADGDAAEAAYERARNGSRPDDIAIGEANVGVARARAEESADTYARLRALTEGVSVTRAQLLEGRRDARITAAQLEDSLKRLALLQAGSREEDIAEALGKRNAAAAALDEARARLDQCSLRAPVAGTARFDVTLGQFVSVAVPTTLVRLTP